MGNSLEQDGIGRRRVSKLGELVDYLGWRGGTSPHLTWAEAEASVGHSFPADFKLLTSHFPSGAFGHRIRVHSPIQDHFSLQRFQFEGEVSLSTAKVICEYESLEYSLWPEPDGLIPWGLGDDEQYYWKPIPASDVDQWPIVLLTTDGGASEYDETVTQFLVNLLTNQITGSVMLFGEEKEAHEFYPF